MVLQIGADAGDVGDHVDALRRSSAAGPTPGQLQQLRRIERAAGEDHFGIGVRGVQRIALAIFDADGAPPREQNAGRQRIGLDCQIGTPPRRPEIADRGRPSAAVARSELEIAGAFLALTVEIVGARKAGLLGRVDEGLA